MRKFISNSVNMIRMVLQFLTNNPTPTAGITAFGTVKTTVSNKLILIDGLNQLINVSSSGVTLDTNLIRFAMTAIAFKLASALRAYASSTHNNTLKQKVKYTKSDFLRMKKEDVDDICQTIHDLADANILAAASFGYAASDVTDAQTAIDLYRASNQNPREAIITKKDANENVELLVKEIKDDLFKEQMDPMVNTLEETEPEFVRKYFFAREIIDLGSTHAKVRGTVKDEDDVPLVGVRFAIRTTGTNDIIDETLSVIKGKFGISQIPAGDYDFKWTFPGYQSVTETNVHISAGKELQRKIVMEVAVPQHVAVNANQIVVLDSGIQPGDEGSAYFKNTSPFGSSLNIYFADSPGNPFTGTGLTLVSGQEVTVDSNDIGPLKAYLLVQNNSPFNGGLDFTNLE
jgi:hypothetical protein